MSFLDHTRRPAGLGGRLMVRVMNLGHRSLTRWGLSQLPDAQYREILDCGRGGGAAIKRLLRACPQSAVWGVDYSAVSVQAARRAANVGKRRFPACCRKKCAGCRIAAFCLFCVSEQICTAPFQTNFLHNLPFSANNSFVVFNRQGRFRYESNWHCSPH